jgi:hypothetical protein
MNQVPENYILVSEQIKKKYPVNATAQIEQ